MIFIMIIIGWPQLAACLVTVVCTTLTAVTNMYLGERFCKEGAARSRKVQYWTDAIIGTSESIDVR